MCSFFKVIRPSFFKYTMTLIECVLLTLIECVLILFFKYTTDTDRNVLLTLIECVHSMTRIACVLLFSHFVLIIRRLSASLINYPSNIHPDDTPHVDYYFLFFIFVNLIITSAEVITARQSTDFFFAAPPFFLSSAAQGVSSIDMYISTLLASAEDDRTPRADNGLIINQKIIIGRN